MSARDPDPDDPDAEEGDRDPYYAYKAALIGAPWELWLRPTELAWRVGSYRGTVPYRQIKRVRLSFRPLTLQSHRFTTEIWSTESPKIRISSTSWRTLIEQARQDADYRAFVTELHKRLAAERSSALFQAGMPVVSYAVGLLASVAAALAFAGMIVRALQMGERGAAAVVAGFFVIFGWQIGSYFMRNRPGVYRPEAPPEQLLPRA